MKLFFRQIKFLFLFALLISGKQYAQNSHGEAYVDQNGVIKWKKTNEEVHGFGVNYTAPFAHAYRTAQRMGVDVRKAIDNDVYHFTRLGFDLYRVHVWDTEISDTLGNLLENEHLETFDYLLKKLKDRGINFILTPIAYWGNGWPEPDEDTPGFSHKYGKAESLTNPEAIKAQQNYLKQFLNHVNPYTGVAYKDEPNLIAVEVSNEPHHRGTPKEVTAFIRKMVKAIRSTGTKKPVFYNISHSTHLENAYFDAGIDGGTFQWYPTGLGFGKELEGNLLPNVNDYRIPFDSIIRKNHGAKIVYEFDAADVLKSYMYPAMARSFRKAGIQLATQFAYDPTFMASHNTEYNTHYTNLAYTPTKALSLMIAGKVFHKVPMYKDFGSYPENQGFGDFSVSYEKNLATYNSEEDFIYTNSNEIEPKNPEALEHLAGFGDSKIVEYEGKGAYFLDKLKPGVWRLEVMPDAIIVQNPLGKNSPEKTVAVINWKSWPMKLKLEDLRSDFSVTALNEGNSFETTAENGQFQISPGTYLLKEKGAEFNENEDYHLHRIGLREFTAPETTIEKTYVLHEPVQESSADSPLELSAEIIS
ncbi:MAG: cellulase family glycosylhydrolase, partial [Salegentibacter sp.]